MGEVYKARDERLNRTVAIKRMLADDIGRFQIEARAIAAINHPHICQIYDVGPDYLFMRRCSSCARIARVSAIRCTIPSRPRLSWSLTAVPGAASSVSISRR